MNERFECIEKHLYCRRYQTGAGEQMLYLAQFTCWKGRRRKFQLGDNLQEAKDRLGELRTLNRARFDFDAEREKAAEHRRRAVTFSLWGNRYFREGLSPSDLRESSLDREKRAFAYLEKFFGDLPLTDITKATILQYRKK